MFATTNTVQEWGLRWRSFFLILIGVFARIGPASKVAAFVLVPKPRVTPTKNNFHPFRQGHGRLIYHNKQNVQFIPAYGGRSTAPIASLAALASSDDELNRIEIGIQTSQILMDARRRNELKENIRLQFPLVPESLIDLGIDVTAQAFTKVVPEKMQAALRPGGMELMRPEIEQVIVEYALEQPAVIDVPILQKREKRTIISSIVSVALDCVLKDAQEILAAPEVRLEELEEMVKEIKARMGFRRLVLYRIRRNRKTLMIGATFSIFAMIVYQQRSLPVVARCVSAAAKACAAIASVATRSYTALSDLSRNTMKYLIRAKRAIAAMRP